MKSEMDVDNLSDAELTQALQQYGETEVFAPEEESPRTEEAAPETEEPAAEPQETAGTPKPEPAEKSPQQLMAELENLKIALKQARSERKLYAKALERVAEIMEAQKAAQEQAQPAQQAINLDDLPEDHQQFLSLAQQYLKPYLDRLNEVYQAIQTQRQSQMTAMSYDYQAREYARQNPDFEPAVKHFGGRIQARARILFPEDPGMQQQYMQSQLNAAMQITPQQLYQYIIETEGYVPRHGQGGTPGLTEAPAAAPEPKPEKIKSLGTMGASGSPAGRTTLEEAAQNILNADISTLMAMSPREFEQVLKQFTK